MFVVLQSHAIAGRQIRLLVPCWLGLMLVFMAGSAAEAAGTNETKTATPLNLANPALLTGTFYQLGSNRKTVLFQFRRKAVRDRDDIRVEQVFSLPDGTTACREVIHYRNDRLVSYEMEDFRAGLRGSIDVKADPKKADREKMALEFIQDRKRGQEIDSATKASPTNTLIADTIYPYILDHWSELAGGASVKFHFVSLDPPDIFSFRVVKEADITWDGKPAVRIKMEPSNLIVAHLIRPIYFVIETAAPHRIFSYSGRMTPRVKVDGNWNFAEAEAVFDWK